MNMECFKDGFREAGKLFILLGFFSPILFSQDQGSMDQDFLSSLPEAVQEELEKDTDQPQLIDKLLQSKTSALKNKEALKILKDQIDSLTLKIENQSGEINSLRRFGESFFNSTQSTFMPVNVPNLNSDYILDIGDKISIQIIGEKPQEIPNASIERDGSLSIPGIGKVLVAGLPLAKASNLISQYVQERSIGADVYTTLSDLRDMQIIMLGHVENPGVYTISGNSNILHAINVSGGIKETGSYRKIKVIRNQKDVGIFDLYNIFLQGSGPIFDFQLRSGDSIFIEPLTFLVSISGGVNIPGIYDILPNETLEDLLIFSGGLSQDANRFENLILERESSQGFDFLNIQSSDLSIALQPRDSVTIPMYKKEIKDSISVTLNGMFVKPGVYSIKEGETLSQIINRAGGFKSNAYPYGGIFIRKSAGKQSEVFSKRIYSDTINFLVSNLGGGSPGASTQPLTGDFLNILLEEFNAQDSVNRIVTSFDLDDLRNNPMLDTELMDDDIIEIPSIPNYVYLFGDFNQSVILPYSPGSSIQDYIKLAGGKKSSATPHLIVIDPDGKSNYYEMKRFNLFENDPEIYPGSIIYLPRELGKIKGITFAAAVAPILSSLTLSLASINAIND
jgi:protein involved in polysaccharide export with SLBB domain